jgi:hypothetical protein
MEQGYIVSIGRRGGSLVATQTQAQRGKCFVMPAFANSCPQYEQMPFDCFLLA